ncbi:MAG: hypothetical protein D6725_00145 [Planctomycetota bacterium]|nr:MAG: hypothetical protein D6725_00145 [Planctomycetota bacterium]
MSTTAPTTRLRAALQAGGPSQLLDALIEQLREKGDYHRLFDALLLKKRVELGLPLERLTTFDNVPEDKRSEFQDAYIAAAREVGRLLLDAGQLKDAWIYFRTIEEPEPVADAIERAAASLEEGDERVEELVNLALYEGAHPIKGLELILRNYGICNTITTLDQCFGQLTPEQRRQAAAMLVRQLYSDLRQSLQYDIQQRIAGAPVSDSIAELIRGRDHLFEGGTYHVDVSHLNSVVRFARVLEPADPELKLAVELAEYGGKLDKQFQYPGDPPFEDFYAAHRHFFNALLGRDVEQAVQYFRRKVEEASDEQDRQLAAYVLVDLLRRIGRSNEAAEIAAEHLSRLDDPHGFSFVSLCREAGRLDLLEQAADRNDDPLQAAIALLTRQQAADK